MVHIHANWTPSRFCFFCSSSVLTAAAASAIFLGKSEVFYLGSSFFLRKKGTTAVLSVTDDGHGWVNRETDRFFAASGVQLAQTNPGGQFHFRRAAFSQELKSKVGLALAKTASLCINLNLDGAPIASSSHTHPSHSQTSRLLTSSLSLGVPVPRPTQCV
jgi:hypothetical protein